MSEENKPVIEKKEEKEQWKFANKPLTIREAITLKIPLKELFQVEGITMPISWTSLIRLVNYKMVEGKKIDLDTTVMEGINAYSGCMTTVFL